MEAWIWDYALGMSVAWIATSVGMTLRQWFREARTDFKVETVGHEELLHNIKSWRGRP